jgi:hypothetical protein
VRADDVFHSHNSGSFYTGITGPYYAPGLQADPATNMLNLRGTLSLMGGASTSRAERLDLSLFVSNLFDAQPTLLKRNKGVDVSTLYYATHVQTSHGGPYRHLAVLSHCHGPATLRAMVAP